MRRTLNSGTTVLKAGSGLVLQGINNKGPFNVRPGISHPKLAITEK